MGKRILLTAFRNTSAELLLEGVAEYRTLLLPNDKIRDSEKLIEVISKEKFDYIISIGQRPNIKNKVHIETTAREGQDSLSTKFNCEGLLGLLTEYGITAKISCNAGTSYCNQLYLNGLRYIFRSNMDIKMVFVHIPLVRNISDFKSFRKQFMNVITGVKEGHI